MQSQCVHSVHTGPSPHACLSPRGRVAWCRGMWPLLVCGFAAQVVLGALSRGFGLCFVAFTGSDEVCQCYRTAGVLVFVRH